MNRRIVRPNLLVIPGLALGIFFNAAQSGMASLVTFVAQGTVNSMDPRLASPLFSVGDAFTVTFTFDSLTPDSDPSPNRGFYTTTSLSVTIGTYTTIASGNSSISVDNDLGFGVGDRYRIDTPGLSGPSVNGFVATLPQTPLLQLSDPGGTALSSDALPISPPDPADFISGGGFLALEFFDPTLPPPDPDEIGSQLPAFVSADVSSISLIPEPTTLFLLILGGIAALRRRRA